MGVKKAKEKHTGEPHHLDGPASLHEPLLQELHLRRLAAPVEPLQDDECPSLTLPLPLGGTIIDTSHG